MNIDGIVAGEGMCCGVCSTKMIQVDIATSYYWICQECGHYTQFLKVV